MSGLHKISLEKLGDFGSFGKPIFPRLCGWQRTLEFCPCDGYGLYSRMTLTASWVRYW
jgi:hypothetical protein